MFFIIKEFTKNLIKFVLNYFFDLDFNLTGIPAEFFSVDTQTLLSSKSLNNFSCSEFEYTYQKGLPIGYFLFVSSIVVFMILIAYNVGSNITPVSFDIDVIENPLPKLPKGLLLYNCNRVSGFSALNYNRSVNNNESIFNLSDDI